MKKRKKNEKKWKKMEKGEITLTNELKRES
jgi:hypothetical protein